MTHTASPLRVLVDPQPTGGDWNMAVDAVLLNSAVSAGQCSLRWYQWRAPTLSLGHFQSGDDPLIDRRFSALPRVRRLSGGGAILHDRELTYSCAIAPTHPLAARPMELYRVLHAAIVAALADFGVTIQPRGVTDRKLDANFLCFSRSDANDLLLAEHKVLGSAQRRRRGAVLQHGSLLLARSPMAPEFPGICDLFASAPAVEPLREHLVVATAQALGLPAEVSCLTIAEHTLAGELLESVTL